jgi:hypothetical protein
LQFFVKLNDCVAVRVSDLRQGKADGQNIRGIEARLLAA